MTFSRSVTYRLLSRAGVWQVGLVVAAIGLTWSFLVVGLHQEYRDAVEGALRETTALTRGLRETATASFDTIDQTLIDLRDAQARDPVGFDVKRWYEAHRFANGLIIQATIVGADGIVRQSNLPVPARTDLSDREHIRFQQQSTSDEMFISKPVTGRVSNRKSLNVTRKIIDPDGRYGGTVVVSAGLDYLTRFYEALSTRGVIALVGLADGVIRARAPVDNELVGTIDPDIARFRQGAATGSFITDDGAGRPQRIVSYSVLPKYPLVVRVELDAEQVFDQYDRDYRRSMLVGAALTLLFVMGGAMLVRQRDRLLASRGALTATLENISQGILMVDADGRVPVINQRAIELLRLPPALMNHDPSFREILAYQLATREFGRPEAANQEFIRFVEAGGLGPPFETYERVRPDGTALEVRTQPLADGGAVRTFTDTTERKKTEAALAAARDAAEAGARARAEFIAVMSHEIRTPLNGILGVAELLQGLDLSPAAEEYVRIITGSGNHLMQIINDILDFSSLNAARLDLEEIAFDLREALSQAVAPLRYQAEAKGLSLSLDVAPDVPSRLIGDAQRLRQIVLNLAANGVKFTQQGFVRIEVAKLREDSGGVRLGFSVTDTGIGISAEVQGRLFNEFTQGDTSIRRRFGGSGLGLAISRRLIALMDGDISVESMPGAGSTFRFSIRLRRPPAAADRIGAESAARERGQVPEMKHSLRILLAEDNATNRFVATRMLQRLGHTVDSVVDGAAAVEAVRQDKYDLVLMDIMMPEMDGLSAARAIRTLPGACASIPIVGLTASAMASDEIACREAGMNGFITKPINAAQLEAAMREAAA